MAEPSKILTVSYGTFSCTLEGFDDAFDMMKAIAEYFRDLAADDRFFGAEPATPDPDMLARIAEREVERRVDARLEQGGYVLRPAALAAGGGAEAASRPAAEAPATEAAAPRPEATPEPRPEAAPAETGSEGAVSRTMGRVDAEAEAPAPAEPVADEQVAEAPEAAPASETETESAEEIVARAAREQTPDEPAVAETEDMAIAPPEVATGAEVSEPLAEPTEAEAPVEEPAEETAEEPVEFAADDTPEPEMVERSEAEAVSESEPAPAPAPARDEITGDSVAAKLARIRAVAGRAPAPVADETEEEGPAVATSSALQAILSEARDDEEEESLGASFEADPSEEEPEAPEEELTEPEETTAEAEDQEAEEATGTGPEEPEEAEQLQREPIRARVVRMRRSEFEALHGEPEDETDEAGADLARLDGLDDLDDDSGQDTVSGLSAEDEAALMEELAEVERMDRPEEPEDEAETAETEEASDDAPATGPTPVPDSHSADRRSRAALLARAPEADEAGMSRILSETDAHMQEPEANRRREAIAHLKAAVAATEAARQLGESGREDNGENMFREDLDEVVRPRHVVRPQTHSERPRPAPLKLVASQRIDVAPPENTGPVMPRRVQAGAIETPAVMDGEEAERFAAYAAEMGATGLTDMLEAAAAHAAFVEGAEDISRPQMLRKVQAIVTDGFSREDGLRAFGTLLRQGRIEKVRNGRFRVSAQSRFNPTRAASGG
ncbi:hypothetical protein [Histidinibacterium aquaticum]|uniref:hypothetical protein n=1 Tax=Histidinibacterium aquaticum TaxID=2613962 RepID=UPI00168A62E7|nr:hypothetical protein [Histidinibacterium aquaticum]